MYFAFAKFQRPYKTNKKILIPGLQPEKIVQMKLILWVISYIILRKRVNLENKRKILVLSFARI